MRQMRMPLAREPRLGHADYWMTPPLLLVHVIMNDMAYCDLCDLDREFCEHSMTERRRNAAAAAGGLLISPADIAPSRTATIKATIRITACGPGSTPHAHGNVWGTASSCPPPAAIVLA